jgi:hypothetical protein
MTKMKHGLFSIAVNAEGSTTCAEMNVQQLATKCFTMVVTTVVQ